MKSSDRIGPDFESLGGPQSGPKYEVALSRHTEEYEII